MLKKKIIGVLEKIIVRLKDKGEFLVPSNIDMVKLGQRAKDALFNEAYGVAIEELERAYFSMWRNSSPMDTDKREDVWQRLQAMKDIEGKLTSFMNNAIIAQKLKEGEKK